MKKFLTEKNLMWAAIVVLAVLHFCPALGCGSGKDRPDAMRQRMSQMRERMGSGGMSQMRERMGSSGDTGRGSWLKERAKGQKEGRKRGPKHSE